MHALQGDVIMIVGGLQILLKERRLLLLIVYGVLHTPIYAGFSNMLPTILAYGGFSGGNRYRLLS